MEELDGHEDAIAGLSAIEEHDGLEVITEGYAAAIEINNLGHGTVGVGHELKPDAGAGEVVTVERLGDLEPAAIPDGVHGRAGIGGDGLPGGIVEIGRFGVGNVTGMKFPIGGGERVEGGQLPNGAMGGGGEGCEIISGRLSTGWMSDCDKRECEEQEREGVA